MSDNPVTLSSANPFNRITPNTVGADAYKEGSRFFATVSSIIGSDNLKGIMSSFYKEKVDKLNTTKELEEYLELKSGKDLTKYFKRFVYGLA
jgi:aminopeptidase N